MSRLRAMALLVAAAAVPLAAQAQRIDVSPRLGIGWQDSNMTLELGARVEAAVGGIGAYTRVGLRGFSSGCAESLPARCDYPGSSAAEAGLGLSMILRPDRPLSLYLSTGLGIMQWITDNRFDQGGRDPFVEVEAGLRHALGDRVSLVLGVHALRVGSVERPPNGDLSIVSDHDVRILDPLIGVTFGFGSR